MLISEARKRLFLILLSLAFLFRLGFGLCSEFWNTDEKQVYLIGLKFYKTGAWPYFGPDVTDTIQIPGALQGLTTGLPFYLLPIPEAPYILLNLLFWFRKKYAQKDWRAMKYLTLATVGLIYAGFAFSFRPPHSHMYYVAFPVAMLYSLYCFSNCRGRACPRPRCSGI
jgi:hypothetical protein